MSPTCGGRIEDFWRRDICVRRVVIQEEMASDIEHRNTEKEITRFCILEQIVNVLVMSKQWV